MSASPTIFDPVDFASLTLPNRMFMAPMTRGRARPDGVPQEPMPEYYRQRAGAGLIITEATAVSPQGVGWVNAPGIFSDAQEAGWRAVTEAVHAAGGRIVLQLWHMGRVSHPDFHEGALPVGPSAIAADGYTHTPQGKQDYVTPRALDAEELPGIAADYAAAARRAIAAGFDAVEIHGANGYLIDQFIRDGANRRTDAFGGSIENRWRFPLMVARAVADAVGAERTGIRLSPTGDYNGMSDSDPAASYAYGSARLSELGLLYVHVVEPVGEAQTNGAGDPRIHPRIRAAFDGRLILNGGYDVDSANAALASGEADAIAFGVKFLANPDLPARFADGADLNAPDFGTLYTPGAKGYVDYPALS
jgi:N-ethylmaleimide reductase